MFWNTFLQHSTFFEVFQGITTCLHEPLTNNNMASRQKQLKSIKHQKTLIQVGNRKRSLKTSNSSFLRINNCSPLDQNLLDYLANTSAINYSLILRLSLGLSGTINKPHFIESATKREGNSSKTSLSQSSSVSQGNKPKNPQYTYGKSHFKAVVLTPYSSLNYLRESSHHTAELQLLRISASESKIKVVHYTATKQNTTSILSCSAH